ncbi:MAG: bifunctional molybdenum cofactor biosynthesis protein MoaC/MoaB [Planctomycetota bacterium]
MTNPAPETPRPGLSHISADGSARMVDVGSKPVTNRTAVAEGRVRVGAAVADAIRENGLKKGDLLSVARLGGIQAAKRTSDLVLMCHPLPLSHIAVEATLKGETVVITASAKTAGQTGVEMEALTAVAGAALNVVDMGKALNPAIVIESLRVVEKRGGKSGPAGKPAADYRVKLLIASDTRSSGENEDKAIGPLTAAVEAFLGGAVVASVIVPDDAVRVEATLRGWLGDGPPDLILTSGGTGVGPRDVTPEATAAVIERPHPGLLDLARSRCLPGLPSAYLSRGVAGVAGRTLIVNLPGSPKGAVDTLRLMSDVLPHALDTVRGGGDDHPTG